jgi:rSAM/selenodomain-associated transferase 2
MEVGVLLRGDRPAVSIVIPVYREVRLVHEMLATIEPFMGLHEIIIADGGSDDGTYEALKERATATLIRAPRGRPKQMNAGAETARGHVLLFLHADTTLDPEGPELALREIDRGADAGCFLVRTKSTHARLKIGAALQSMRSRLLTSATGDQAIFIRRTVFEELGGFREDLPICEDIDLVQRLTAYKGRQRFACVGHHVVTSGRRWEAQGINRTIALMWALRAAYHLGAHPARLVKYYGIVR